MGKNRKEYINQYNRDKRVRVSLNLSKECEVDIINAIERECKGNKQAGVKSLIRKGIRYENEHKPPVIC